MQNIYNQSLAVFAAVFLTFGSIGAIVAVPSAHASQLAPMVV